MKNLVKKVVALFVLIIILMNSIPFTTFAIELQNDSVNEEKSELIIDNSNSENSTTENEDADEEDIVEEETTESDEAEEETTESNETEEEAAENNDAEEGATENNDAEEDKIYASSNLKLKNATNVTAIRKAPQANTATGELIIENEDIRLNGKAIKNYPDVKDGDSVTIAFDWRIQNNENKLHYEKELNLLNIELNESEGEVYDDDDESIAYYKIEDGKLTFDFYEAQIKNKSNISGGSIFLGWVSIDAEKTKYDKKI